ncbi:MAG: redox-sensing transcriptional repressor Rex [Clostridia bacterium]|nr:redox-sensing transcriptional repressor Rex [Clostridia bacterium]
MTNKSNISMSVIRRLPRYYRYLRDLEKSGIVRVSSKELSVRMGFTASQIRQDFNCFGGFGQQGYGYSVSNLRERIGEILGVANLKKCVLIGAGNLGRALLSIDFSQMGFDLVGIFDTNTDIIGKEVRGYKVYGTEIIAEFCAREKPEMAIICTPTDSAEEICDTLFENGVNAFWNFSHYDISMKHPEAMVETVHLNDSIMTLSYLLDETQ